MALGQSVVRILEAAGYEVVPHAYINDLGNAVARCLWGYKKFHDGEVPPKGDENKFFGDVYAQATAALEKDANAKTEVSEVQKQLEEGKGEWIKLWKTTNKWSLNGLKVSFKDFGLDLKKIYLESDVLKRSKKIVKQLIKRGIATHSEGAWVVRLEEQGLGVSILVKSDGTHLYNAKDLGLAEKKEEDFHPDRSIYVVDARQKQVMAQLFATLKLMGFNKELQHLSYGHVSLPEGAMSSRKGTVVRYKDFMSHLCGQARSETRNRHSDWNDKILDDVSRKISYGAIKFFMLRSDPDKDIVFDEKESLSFEGFSGPYILYTIARCKSLLDKSSDKPSFAKIKFASKEADAIMRLLATYPEVVVRTALDYRVSRLAQCLFDLAQAFGTFYSQSPVNSEENVDIRRSRLALVEAVRQTLINGIKLLGMEQVDEM
jgi:arginyl-tRNA synthetase